MATPDFVLDLRRHVGTAPLPLVGVTAVVFRDEKVLRTLSRQNDDVDDGWLCDKGRFAYQSTHVKERLTEPLVRNADGALEPASWDDALDRASVILRGAADKTAALAGGGFFWMRRRAEKRI